VTHGEKVVMRLLGSAASGISLDLEKIGLSPHLKDLFKEAISEPNGIVFVTGPTGSGKSTTLYSALHYIDKPGINIMTIEDPVEYQMETITQSQVDAKAGRTFASILRAALRQDPDVILVGEIRDVETAKIASEAALTGHLVISTLHTNNSLQAISRLIEMGVEPHVVAPAIVGVLAQRLARKICEHCIISYKPEAEELEKYFYWDKEMELPMLYKGTGCKYCGGIGYKGRIGIHEFVRINTRLRDRILSHASYNELVKVATEDGFRDMRFDGFCKMLEGQTTLDEVIRVTSTDL
ncbi:MAG: GspE/PulE family protein, partial [Gammaproteobacteria bacterium]|nr:GspE/PulE family protein [Gammaproteobacteria bacterium]